MVYCVEDDYAIRELILYTLETAGYKARGFENGKDFFEAAENEVPEMVLLDLMLPGEDGISILKRMRADRHISDVPVIIATAKGTENDKVTGLDSGADGYLVKPFGMTEMLSNITAVLRRCGGAKQPDDSAVIFTDGLVLDNEKHIVTADGEELRLTLKEYELLRTFMENKERVMSRERLYELVWGSDLAVETRTVDVHVGTLRTKLGKYGKLIQTVRGVGYRMEPEL